MDAKTKKNTIVIVLVWFLFLVFTTVIRKDLTFEYKILEIATSGIFLVISFLLAVTIFEIFYTKSKSNNSKVALKYEKLFDNPFKKAKTFCNVLASLIFLTFIKNAFSDDQATVYDKIISVAIKSFFLGIAYVVVIKDFERGIRAKQLKEKGASGATRRDLN